MMKVLLIGPNGQVGFELARLLSADDNIELVTAKRPECDLARPDSLHAVISREMPGLIINATAYTAVDKAEQEKGVAKQVNFDALAVIAEEAIKCDAAVIHYSTDYVFDGTATAPCKEDDQTRPINCYGVTKLMGEEALIKSGVPALIFRTSWVYGARRDNFLLSMQRLIAERDKLSVVNDQIGAPTWCRSIARGTVEVIHAGGDGLMGFIRNNTGIYHMTNSGQTNWFGFAEKIAAYMKQQGGNVAEIKPIPTSDYPTLAIRPMYSVLDNTKLSKTFNVQLPAWDAALDECMREMPATEDIDRTGN